MRIIFLGTPEFAVASLEALCDNGFDVVAAVTAPDTPSGRGLRMQPSPVKQFADRRGIPVLQPLKLKDPQFLEELRGYSADLQVVVAFRMLPESVWKMPPLGTFNLHASLLPQYRGAAPIQRAIMNGETETGVTTFFLEQEIDTGKIVFAEKVAIGPEETAGELHDSLMAVGARLVVKTAEAIRQGTVQTVSQQELAGGESVLKTAPKIFREDCQVAWSRPAAEVFNQIRGLSPHPGAFSTLRSPRGEEILLKLYKAAKASGPEITVPGTLLTDNRHFLRVACPDGWLDILQIQQAGKRRMAIREFLLGFPLTSGWRFPP